MQMSLYHLSLFNFEGQQYRTNVRSRSMIRFQEKWLIRTSTSGIQPCLNSHHSIVQWVTDFSTRHFCFQKCTEFLFEVADPSLCQLVFNVATAISWVHLKHQFLPQKKQIVFIRQTSSSDSTARVPKTFTPALGFQPTSQSKGTRTFSLKLSPCHASKYCQLISCSNHFAFLDKNDVFSPFSHFVFPKIHYKHELHSDEFLVMYSENFLQLISV